MGADNLSDAVGAPDTQKSRIEALLAAGEALIARTGGDAPRLQAELLLSHALSKPRSYLIAHPDGAVPASSAASYQSLLERAAGGEPTAYRVGEREFGSLALEVSPSVLVPRPETELLVERALSLLATAESRSVCDLGTGSGAVALALSSERLQWRITATDCSSAALELAARNARRHGLHQVEFLRGDWFEPLVGRQFDLIVSNPPYVAADDPALIKLRHEPRVALTPGLAGTEALRRIVVEAPHHLVTGGWLLLEHGVGQAPVLASSLQQRGYVRICCHRDYAGAARVVEAQWPEGTAP